MNPLPEDIRQTLQQVHDQYGTPAYVYFWESVEKQASSLRDAFGDLFSISYAVKANPHPLILSRFSPLVDLYDVSSGGELTTLVQSGIEGTRATFSGPAKTEQELQQALEYDCEVVCESVWELETINRVAMQRDQIAEVLIRINPLKAPKGFSVGMAQKASQFGIDEELLPQALEQVRALGHIKLVGFHVYAGTNLLKESALIEHFELLVQLFREACKQASLTPRKLVFGSGFGIPYELDADPLELATIATKVVPEVELFQREPRFAETEFVLEMGRYLVGPSGYYLMSVLNEKLSRGKHIRICNGGFHHHLAACNMMGSIIRRNWPMWKVNESRDESSETYWLVGPLCTTIDTLAYEIELPTLSRGDCIAIGSSGAYGLTSSPLNFISHPEPKEILVERTGNEFRISDISLAANPSHHAVPSQT